MKGQPVFLQPRLCPGETPWEGARAKGRDPTAIQTCNLPEMFLQRVFLQGQAKPGRKLPRGSASQPTPCSVLKFTKGTAKAPEIPYKEMTALCMLVRAADQDDADYLTSSEGLLWRSRGAGGITAFG